MASVGILFSFVTTFIYLALTECSVINGNTMRSLRCLGMDRKSGCRILSADIPPFERLRELYRNQNRRVKDALDFGNLKSLNKQDLISIHPVILLLIPANELSQLKGENLAYLTAFWAQSRVIVHHIVSAASLSHQRTEFLLKLQGVHIPDENLDVIGEKIVNWEHIIYHGLITVGSPLLAYLPLNYLHNITESEINKQLFFLNTWFKTGGTNHKNWASKSPAIKRTWAKLTNDANFPIELSQWKDGELEKMGNILVGLTTRELNQLDCSHFKDKSVLFNFNFTEIQVRMLFRKCYYWLYLSQDDFKSLTQILGQLTPSDLQKFAKGAVDFHGWTSYPNIVSMATAKQIVEFMVLEGLEQGILNSSTTNWTGQSIKLLGKFIYPLGLTELKHYRDFPLTLPQLKTLQSDHISPAQAFYLTGRGSRLDSNDPYSCFSFLHALPSSNITSQLSSNFAFYLLKHMPLDNRIRSFKLISQMWSHIGEKEMVNYLLKNNNPSLLLDMIPIKTIFENSNKLLSLFSSTKGGFNKVFGSLPDIMLTQLYRSYIPEVSPHNPYQQNLHFLTLGLTCQDINEMPVEEFIFRISQFNELLKKMNKPFPKSLQECCTSKLIIYLKMKSSLIQQFYHEDILDLLTENEAQAVGGFVLSYLSVEDVEFSKISKTIIKLIGQLSLPELMIAAPLHKLRTFITIYTNEYGRVLKKEHLFELGNLTSFLPVELISTMNSSDLKLILESKYLDRRVCANSDVRKAWAKKIIQSVGDPSKWGVDEIEMLGDMMIVFSDIELDQVNLTSLSDTVDVLKSGYCDLIQWHKMTKFYQVCITNILGNGEKNEYINSIKVFTKLLLKGSQMQLSTVKNASELHSLLTDNFIMDSDILLENNDVDEFSVVTKRDAINNSGFTQSPLVNNVDYSLSESTDSQGTLTTIKLQTNEVVISSSFHTSNNDFGIQTISKQLDHVSGEIDSSSPMSLVTTTRITISNEVVDNSNNLKPPVPTVTELSTKQILLDSTTSALESDLISNEDINVKNNFNDLFEKDKDNIMVHMKNVVVYNSPPWTTFNSPEENYIDMENVDSPPEGDLEVNLNSIFKEVNQNKYVSSLKHKEDQIIEPILKRTNRQIKASTEITCDALKMVGSVVELSINRLLLQKMNDRELENCIELLGDIDLPLTEAKIIWKRLDKEDIHLRKKLVKAAEVEDLKGLDLNFSTPWALETIYLLSKYNLNRDLASYIISKVGAENLLSVEEVLALGGFLCKFTDEQLEKTIGPEVIGKVSKVLGENLPCDIPCLERLIKFILRTTNISEWTSLDVKSYGILIAGLDLQNWSNLLQRNKKILYEIDVNMAMCLTENHLKMIPIDMIGTIPYFVRESLISYNKIYPLSWKQRSAFATYHSVKITTKTSSIYSSSFKQSYSLLLTTCLFSFNIYFKFKYVSIL